MCIFQRYPPAGMLFGTVFPGPRFKTSIATYSSWDSTYHMYTYNLGSTPLQCDTFTNMIGTFIYIYKPYELRTHVCSNICHIDMFSICHTQFLTNMTVIVCCRCQHKCVMYWFWQAGNTKTHSQLEN